MLIGAGLIDLTLLCPATSVRMAHHTGRWMLIRGLGGMSRHARVIRRGGYHMVLTARKLSARGAPGCTDAGHIRLLSHSIMIHAGEPRLLRRSNRSCRALYVLKSWWRMPIGK